MSRFARYVIGSFLVLAAMPTFAGAGEAIKNVFVNNTAANPVPVQGIGTQQVSGSVEVSNLPAVQRLRHGVGFVSRDPRNNVVLPNDVVLTDLVITQLAGSTAPVCEVALYEQRGTELNGMQFLYPSTDQRTVELHFVSGLTLPAGADGWGVVVNNECVLKVLWSGYALP